MIPVGKTNGICFCIFKCFNDKCKHHKSSAVTSTPGASRARRTINHQRKEKCEIRSVLEVSYKNLRHVGNANDDSTGIDHNPTLHAADHQRTVSEMQLHNH